MDFQINRETQLCISLSARPGNFGTRFQNYLFRKLDLNFIYKAFPTNELNGALAGIRALGIRGSAISMPFKEACIPYLDALDDSALKVGSVNTIVNEGSGFLRGYNTDTSAVRFLLKKNEISPETSVAVLGSGGMAKAVAWALRDEGFLQGSIVSRNEQAGRALAEKVGWRWSGEFGRERPRFLANATPIGMSGGPEEEDLSFPVENIREADWVFDSVAIPVETPLIQKARSFGKKVITGSDILVPQAVEQFVLYTGFRPSEEWIQEAGVFATHV